ncbi:MAG: hypothetical protein QHJ34_04945 [bacterium]|nr:hypothetical protein [candidate division KSB1 bacterium]MDH7559565.1 hypothetical protein [bacterium]
MRALALFSGGLDSLLATAVIVRQGVEVIALHFVTGFAPPRRGREEEEAGIRWVERAAAAVGARAEVIDVSGPFVEVVRNPRHGYGRFANPCIDCKVFMLRKAKELLVRYDARFVLTGEVLGQRPMSQHLPVLNLIEKESGLRGLLLRPLSAKLLKPTIPEIEGWVNRDQLYGFSGRSRKPQIELAAQLGITSYAQPGGGCMLTDENVARRVLDLLGHKDRSAIGKDELQLCMYGRHFRLSDKVKAVVGRDEWDNLAMEQCAAGRWQLRALAYQGPLTIVDGEASAEELAVAARLTARYCDGKHEKSVAILAEREDEQVNVLVAPMPDAELEGLRI